MPSLADLRNEDMMRLEGYQGERQAAALASGGDYTLQHPSIRQAVISPYELANGLWKPPAGYVPIMGPDGRVLGWKPSGNDATAGPVYMIGYNQSPRPGQPGYYEYDRAGSSWADAGLALTLGGMTLAGGLTAAGAGATGAAAGGGGMTLDGITTAALADSATAIGTPTALGAAGGAGAAVGAATTGGTTAGTAGTGAAEFGALEAGTTAAAPAASSTGGGTAAAGTGSSSGSILSGAGDFLSSDWGQVLSAGLNLYGGYMQADAAEDAANIQAGAAREGIAAAGTITAPQRNIGTLSLYQLASMLGIDPRTAFPDGMPTNPLVPGMPAPGAPGAEFGAFTKPFTMQDLTLDPSYQFRRDEGLNGVNNSGAARGMQLSGPTLKGIQDFGQGLASTEYGNAWNRARTGRLDQYNSLANLAGMGQVASGQFSGQAQQGIEGAGNAMAAGRVGSAGAWGQTLNNVSSQINQNQFLSDYYKNMGMGG